MSTNSDVIRDALGLIGVLRIEQSPSAAQGVQALRVMNDMFFEWEALGINLNYSMQVSTTDDFPLDETMLQTTKSNLAVRLCPYYERQPSPVLVTLATQGYDRLLRDAVIAARVEARMNNLPLDEGRRTSRFGGNIITGD